MSTFKRQNHNVSPSTGEAYPHQFALQTIGMRVRKSINDGYQTPDNFLSTVQKQQQQQQQQPAHPSTVQRTPLPSNVVVPPLLSNSSSTMSTFGSNLEEWESNLDSRLSTIETSLVYQKESLTKRRFDSVDNDW